MDDRSHFLVAATEAFAQSGHSYARTRMYGELALQHLSSVCVASRMKVAHLLCPLTHAPRTVMKALAKDHDQTIAKYVKQHSRTEFGSINAVRVAEKAPEDLIRSFLESTPISSFSVLRQMQAFHLCMERSLPQLSPKECQDLTVNALKYGHLSMVSELANASGLTIEQVHQCFTHSSPDGFIVILVGLGFKSRLLDQLLVRFWGTLLNINQMRDLQKAAASVSPQVAQDLIVSWTKITPVSRYHAIIEASKTCVHELKAQSAPHLREATATQHLASLKA